MGTIRTDGLYWIDPLTTGHRLSLRARNMGSDTIKGNDLDGNPIEIAVVTGRLLEALQERLDRAGVHVLEARVTHLAYAPEIAGAMLQRHQASAIVAARRLIVDGAVGMVEQALADLSERKVVELNDSDRAHMVGNLLVVLCGQQAATPVVQTGR